MCGVIVDIDRTARARPLTVELCPVEMQPVLLALAPPPIVDPSEHFSRETWQLSSGGLHSLLIKQSASGRLPGSRQLRSRVVRNNTTQRRNSPSWRSVRGPGELRGARDGVVNNARRSLCERNACTASALFGSAQGRGHVCCLRVCFGHARGCMDPTQRVLGQSRASVPRERRTVYQPDLEGRAARSSFKIVSSSTRNHACVISRRPQLCLCCKQSPVWPSRPISFLVLLTAKLQP